MKLELQINQEGGSSLYPRLVQNIKNLGTPIYEQNDFREKIEMLSEASVALGTLEALIHEYHKKNPQSMDASIHLGQLEEILIRNLREGIKESILNLPIFSISDLVVEGSVVGDEKIDQLDILLENILDYYMDTVCKRS